MNSIVEECKNYVEGLLALICEEVNIKQVIVEKNGVQSIFSYDTINEKPLGFDDNFPIFSLIFTGNIREDMQTIRSICSDGLKQRSDGKIKVRQPLQSITIYIGSKHV